MWASHAWTLRATKKEIIGLRTFVAKKTDCMTLPSELIDHAPLDVAADLTPWLELW